MKQKKLGKIILLASIPHFFAWVIYGATVYGHDLLPAGMLWWLLGIVISVIIGGYMAEETTPRQTWKHIIKFINE